MTENLHAPTVAKTWHIVNKKNSSFTNKLECVNISMTTRNLILKLKKENPDMHYQRLAELAGCSKSLVFYHISPRSRAKELRRQTLARTRARELKQRLIQESGGQCHICGYHKCSKALEFHHLNPKQKEITIGTALFHNSEDMRRRIQEEVKKCVLLCSNCHKEVEEGITILSGVECRSK